MAVTTQVHTSTGAIAQHFLTGSRLSQAMIEIVVSDIGVDESMCLWAIHNVRGAISDRGRARFWLIAGKEGSVL
jgi:hypothetical protein